MNINNNRAHINTNFPDYKTPYVTSTKGGRITFIDSDRVIITYNHKDAGGRAPRWTTHRMRSKLFKGIEILIILRNYQHSNTTQSTP